MRIIWLIGTVMVALLYTLPEQLATRDRLMDLAAKFDVINHQFKADMP